MHYECELAVVIGKPARRVARADAMAHVAGYTVANDYAIRDYLENWYRPNLRVKSRDGATALGPWLVDAADVATPPQLALRTLVNGRQTQSGNTRDLVFDIPFLIEYLSAFMTLAPGDVILTGTPEGVVERRRRRRGRVRDRRHRPARQHDRRRRGVRPRGASASGAKGIRMRIQHLIDGRPVASRSYFETVESGDAGGARRSRARRRRRGRGRRRRREGRLSRLGANAGGRARAPDAPARRPDRRQRARALAETETRDTGQVIAQTKKQLVPRAADNFHYFAEVCTRVDGHTYPTPTHLNYTLFQPVGVCALISPWNVPFMTATWKVAPCLALGNTAVLKMSELSPLTAARLGELALEAGIPAGVLNVVHGYGGEAGEALVAHRDVRAISFTGSTRTGNRIVQTAGLKKFSMELGGKSPFVVFADADFERALDAAVFMIFSNNGERCTAGSRILVERSIYAEFAARFAERARRLASATRSTRRRSSGR